MIRVPLEQPIAWERIIPPGSLAEKVCALVAVQDVRAWLVGGYVRDRLLGRASHDLDFVVPAGGLALARRVADRFGGAFYALDEERDTGRAILSDEDGHAVVVDVARWRSGDLSADLAARDFTVNALAYDIVGHGGLTDATGGLADLEAGVLRAPVPTAFRADPIRLLRAARLEAQLGFVVEPGTLIWLRKDAPLIAWVAAERVRDELVRLLALPGAARQLARLDELNLLPIVFPELARCRGVVQSEPHYLDVYGHTLQTVFHTESLLQALNLLPAAGPEMAASPLSALPSALAPFAERLQSHLAVETSAGRNRAQMLLWAALCHDWGKPLTRTVDDEARVHFLTHDEKGAEIAVARLRSLVFSTDEVRLVSEIVRHHMRPSLLAREDVLTRRAIYRFFRDTGDVGPETLLLSLADRLGTYGPHLNRDAWEGRLGFVARMLAAYYEHPEVVAPPLLVSGDDLMFALGLVPGPLVGQLLAQVREAQAAGEVTTRDEVLAFARRAAYGG
ncbi:MAG: HD domain-containing protein [Anaerolineae bacterium]|nr:HD domain-containing protein [Anaerolineae bacterium]